MADAISPASYTDTLAVGESVTITKTVTIDDAPSAEAPVDVFFLFDTTGSMGEVIDTAKSTASDVLTGISSFGSLNYGVGVYEDFPVNPFGADADDPRGPDTPYDLLQDITGDTTAAQDAIDSITLGNGWDFPESQLHALTEVANTTAWRDDSTRIVLWFGDEPGHEGDEAGYPGDDTTESTITALQAENVTVVGIDYRNLDGTGQATDITDATDGLLTDGTTDPDAFVDLIVNAISDIFEEYSEVTLDVVGDTSGVDVAIDPVEYTGEYSRASTETFEFDVTFTGLAPGTYDFDIRAMVDGGVVAIEDDLITVPGGPEPVPEPATLILLGTGLAGLVGARRRFKKK